MLFDLKFYESHSFNCVRNLLYKDCEAVFDEKIKNIPFVQIKNKRMRTDSEIHKECEDAQKKREQYLENYQVYISAIAHRGRINVIRYKCEQYFLTNYNFFKNAFLRFNKYDSLESAIQRTDTFNDLWLQMEKWFMRKEENFKQKMALEIKTKTGVSEMKTPNSHGGVANLLKILTKTMERQGASIESIAKVQYAICIQAGFYIPDEFLTDVAVALDYKNTVEAL